MLYFDDGDVPPLLERERVHETEQYNYIGTANPSGGHKAYYGNSSSLPSAQNDFETTEFSTADYMAVDGDDSSYKETANPSADNYLYHKFLLLSSIDKNNVKRLRVRLTMSSSDSSLQSMDGGVLYAWNGSNWVELARTSDSSITDLTYSTAEAEIARQFVDSEDNYIRLLLRSRNRRDGSNALSLRTYYVAAEINEGLNLTIDLSHKAILDENDDVVWVKNLTRGTTLQKDIEYTIASDRRSVNVGLPFARLSNSKCFPVSSTDIFDCATEDISMSIWIRVFSVPSATQAIVSKGWSAYYGIYVSSTGLVRGSLRPSGCSSIYTPSISEAYIVDGKWHHVAVTMDRDGLMKCYIDSVLIGSGVDISSVSGYSLHSDDGFSVGAMYDHGYTLNGDVRCARLYIAPNSHWSEADVLTQFKNPFDDTLGGTITESWMFDDSASSALITGSQGINLGLDEGDTTNYGTHSRTESAESGDEVEVKYNRYFEVMFASIPEEWLSGDPSSGNRSRSAEVVLETLSESR